MTEVEFERTYSETLVKIEDAIEESGADLDYETVNDILTITCEDGSAVIITRQGPTRQLWLAARSGGFHFDYDPEQGDWVRTGDGRTLTDMLQEILREQGGVEVSL